jgi:TatD DNase family protein
MKYFDAHCHIQFPPYEEDRTVLLASMQKNEVGGLIVGVDLGSSKKAITLADGKTLFASAGLHPNDTPDEVFDMNAYRTLLEDKKAVSVGECGLDFFRPEEPEKEKQRQKEVFQKQIDLAGELGLPLMIHARPSKGTMDAYEDATHMLVEAKKTYGDNLKGNMHFFVGNIYVARKLLELDFTFSYTAILTFARDYDEVVRFIPLTHLLTETDSPYASPKESRGKRNDPNAVRRVVEAIAEIRGEDEEVVREAVLANARRVFMLP